MVTYWPKSKESTHKIGCTNEELLNKVEFLEQEPCARVEIREIVTVTLD